MNRNRASSMPCPRCRKLVSANAARCIHCGLLRPGLYVSLPVLNRLLREDLSFSNSLVLVCFVLYVLALALDITGLTTFNSLLSLLSPTSESLYKLGMSGAIPWSLGRWWTLLTATYLHGSILHIAFNMLWLRQIGPLVEELFGASRFLIIYTLAGLFGSLLSTLAGTFLFVGASGSIFGLFAALIYYGRHRGGTFGSGILRRMLIWAAIGFLLGIAIPGIDNWGHLGGFVGGFLCAFLLSYQEKNRQSLGHHLGAVAALAAISVCFGMMLVAFFAS